VIAAIVGPAIGAFAFAALMALVAAKPRSTWRARSAWQYRNPDAVEPSNASYGVSSVACGLMAVVGLAVGTWALTAESPDGRKARLAREEAKCNEVRGRFVAVVDADVGDDGRITNFGALRALAAELDVSFEDISLPNAPFSNYGVNRDGEQLFTISNTRVSGC